MSFALSPLCQTDEQPLALLMPFEAMARVSMWRRGVHGMLAARGVTCM